MTAPTSDDRRWVAFVHGADRTGTLTALAGVFSTRGVSFDSIATSDVAEGVGMIVVTFTASERRMRLLIRTVARLSAVRAVTVHPVDDPAVRAAAVVVLPGTVTDFAPPADTAVRWSGDPAAGQPVLVEGPLLDVERVVADARSRGAAAVATAVLPPVEG
jgi:acetolactate synthase small subunit